MDALHAHKTIRIQSVAGRDVTDQIGRSVHNAAIEGGEANPEPRRDMLGPAPKSFKPFEEESSAPADAGAQSEANSIAMASAKRAKEAAEAASKEVEQKAAINRVAKIDPSAPQKAEKAAIEAAAKAEAIATNPLAAAGAAAEAAPAALAQVKGVGEDALHEDKLHKI